MHHDEALFANEAFYLAFANRDLDAMDRLWHPQPDVVCVHPGWPPLTERAAVMESWARILGNPDQPDVAVHALPPLAVGAGVVVVCYESLRNGGGDRTVMVASNVFVDTADGPRLVLHQSGLCGDPPPLPDPTVPAFDA